MQEPSDTSPGAGAKLAKLDEFRVTASREIGAALLALSDRKVPLTLHAAEGEGAYTTILWSVELDHARLGFWADVNDPRVQTLVDRRQATAVGHLDNVKLQFDLRDIALVRGNPVSVLRCPAPHELFRFQRRDAYRIRPLMKDQPNVRLVHPDLDAAPIQLRIIDVSLGGCALHLPDDLPILQGGAVLRQVEIELDGDTAFTVDLRIVNVCPVGSNAVGMRLGCEFVAPGGDVLRVLQRFIDDAQKRRASRR